MRQPKWMSPSTWVEFLSTWQKADGQICCVDCDTCDATLLSVDHFVPRSAGGTDQISNLQPLCISCNSRKGNRADGYWSRTFFFDRPLNTANLRVSQQDFVLNPIHDYEDFFASPYSAINGKLFCFFQNVGAGKTLGMFCLPFALNACARNAGPGRPRVDRMLLVTKDKALRAQVAAELREEPVRFGLISEAPRVVEISNKAQLLQAEQDYDIAVMCPNMLWAQPDSANGNFSYTWIPGIERILQRHPLIVFDEMHYAYAGIRRLVHAARHSLVFGFTASPINSCGNLLEDMIRVTIYSYPEAVINDGSMKYLADHARCVNVLTVSEQKAFGKEWDTDSRLSGLATVRSVIIEVVKKVYELDEVGLLRRPDDMLRDGHWQHYRGSETLTSGSAFPARALISVDSIETANDVVDFLNRHFESNRNRYPRKLGWQAVAAHSRSPTPFDRSHPFFHYKETGTLDAKCCRFLVVNRMAVEGMNNKYLLVWGAAEHCGSLREIIQRIMSKRQ